MSDAAIDAQAVRRAAQLARIALSDDEADALANELDEVRAWIDQLQGVDVTEVAPLIHPNHAEAPTRDDEVQGQLSQEQALANSPAQAEGHFLVPRVVG